MWKWYYLKSLLNILRCINLYLNIILIYNHQRIGKLQNLNRKNIFFYTLFELIPLGLRNLAFLFLIHLVIKPYHYHKRVDPLIQ